MSHTQPERFLRLPEVLARVEYSKATWYRRVKARTAPQPVRDGGAARWVESEVNAWIESLKSSRNVRGNAHMTAAQEVEDEQE